MSYGMTRVIQAFDDLGLRHGSQMAKIFEGGEERGGESGFVRESGAAMYLIEMVSVESEHRRVHSVTGGSGTPQLHAGLRVILLPHPPQTTPSILPTHNPDSLARSSPRRTVFAKGRGGGGAGCEEARSQRHMPRLRGWSRWLVDSLTVETGRVGTYSSRVRPGKSELWASSGWGHWIELETAAKGLAAEGFALAGVHVENSWGAGQRGYAIHRGSAVEEVGVQWSDAVGVSSSTSEELASAVEASHPQKPAKRNEKGTGMERVKNTPGLCLYLRPRRGLHLWTQCPFIPGHFNLSPPQIHPQPAFPSIIESPPPDDGAREQLIKVADTGRPPASSLAGRGACTTPQSWRARRCTGDVHKIALGQGERELRRHGVDRELRRGTKTARVLERVSQSQTWNLLASHGLKLMEGPFPTLLHPQRAVVPPSLGLGFSWRPVHLNSFPASTPPY
ncbi:hypothetical protein FA13DRAFT_1713709 [Coprinellus micaceus]|uniref:Uncharacterized protein n=1 Tax=Coprinellus micaceus TaxID=71717 RepID=A0A4Y7SVW4_COPMI|nr:hypothetical protein FA13DRAFT_1713709 [Coprinellus micaceus]